MKQKVIIIIPTKNEEKSISKVLRGIPKEYKIVVVNKSTDKTKEIANKAGATVIAQKGNGKGNAMKEAVNKVGSIDDIIVFIDGDATYPTNKIKNLVNKIKNENYDIVYGVRKLKYNKNISLSHLIGNDLLKGIAGILYKKTSDLLTGMFALKKKKFLELNLKSSGFEIETEIFIKSVKNNFKIGEIEVPYYRRIGKQKINTFKDGLKILWVLLKYKFI